MKNYTIAKTGLLGMLLLFLIAPVLYDSAARPAIDVSSRVMDENAIMRAVQRTFKDLTLLGDTELIPAQGAGVKIRLLGMHMRCGAAVTVRLKTGGSNLSAAYSLGINDEILMPETKHGWFETGANEALNANLSLGVSCGAQVIWLPVT